MFRGWPLAVIIAIALPGLTMAQMTSTNYGVSSDALVGGGAYGTSTNYQATDIVTESATPSGENLTSTNYLACAGFGCTSLLPSLTSVITTSTSACTSSTPPLPSLAQALGALSISAVSTAPERVCVIVSTVLMGGVTVTVKSANTGLQSVATPASVIPSATATLIPGAPGYGVCASAAALFTKEAPYNGACDTSTNHSVGLINTSAQNIFTASGNVTNAVGEMLTKAAISGATPAASDYADTVTVIVTGTF